MPLAQDPEGVMEALHEVECEEAAVRDAGGRRVRRDSSPTGPRSVAGDLVVTARGDTEVTVDGDPGQHRLRGARGRRPTRTWLTVAGAGDVGRVPVELVVDRCDTHALIESKRTFKFPLEVRLDGGPPALVVLEAGWARPGTSCGV